ncbi:MAG TPA: O-antigen ligase family protein, partial [Methylocystis sp.]|nr:O-antigen ligase family protein [Methylocystis sp.]
MRPAHDNSTPAFDEAGQAAARPSGFAQLAREAKVETLIFFGLLIGLAWTPFWLGGNRALGWGLDGVYFPSLALVYEAQLLLAGAPHPVGVKRLAVPAALLALVVIWIFVQLSTIFPAPIQHPIWGMAA